MKQNESAIFSPYEFPLAYQRGSAAHGLLHQDSEMHLDNSSQDSDAGEPIIYTLYKQLPFLNAMLLPFQLRVTLNTDNIIYIHNCLKMLNIEKRNQFSKLNIGQMGKDLLVPH